MNIENKVSVIGLGMMGSTLAQLLLRERYRVTVWNRTSGKAEPLVREGAVLASGAAAAVAASPIVVICVYDYKAANEILGPKDVASALAGRVLLQLTTGSPQEARDSEAWAQKHGAEYIAGAIQAAPSQMARPDTTILVSGAETAFQRSEPLLAIFGGNVKYLGESVGAASAMDLATLSYVYGAVLGFFHGARVCEAEGFRVTLTGRLSPKSHRASGNSLDTRVVSFSRETMRFPKARSESRSKPPKGSRKRPGPRGSTTSSRP